MSVALTTLFEYEGFIAAGNQSYAVAVSTGVNLATYSLTVLTNKPWIWASVSVITAVRVGGTSSLL